MFIAFKLMISWFCTAMNMGLIRPVYNLTVTGCKRMETKTWGNNNLKIKPPKAVWPIAEGNVVTVLFIFRGLMF